MNDPFFLILKDGPKWRYFENPIETLIVKSPQEISATLTRLDDFLKNGNYIAGFMSYEAAPGIDDALITKELEKFPYAVFGVFDTYKTSENLPVEKTDYVLGEWITSQNEQIYCSNIERIKEHIAQGNTYQVNYTLRLNCTFKGSAFSFFKTLVNNQQSDYAAFVQFENFSICSASPELFFKLDGERIISRPMKGTACRGLTYSDDISQRDKLKSSEKERAENLMIVDMVRNDMGKICKPNSIEVKDLFKTERYPTVWQMTSEVHGKTEASFSSIFKALFPCASITGAPKTKTMQLINDLEQTPRKLYTGSIGYFGPGRKALFNVAIRTAIIDNYKSRVEYGVGSGIVWDSIDVMEYEECKIKAKVLTNTKVDFKLLETMLATKSKGIFLLDYHLKRMRESAEFFNYPFNEKKIKEELAKILTGNSSDLKIRLLLAENGQIEIENSVYISPTRNTKKVLLASNPINSSDRYLYHKTTYRKAYHDAHEQIKRDNLDDVILYNEKGQLTESTICNLVVKQQGKYYTPPVVCGLLNGTFRQSLIDQKMVSEKIIFINDIEQAEQIFLINSVQQWVNIEFH